MSEAHTDARRSGWFVGLIDGAARALAFGGPPASTSPSSASPAPARPRRVSESGDVKGKSAEVHRLVAEGVAPAEIARRTALAQDTVALLLHLAPPEPVESAARGTFFRILQTRMAS